MALLVEDRIYPHLIGGDIGCGMSLFQSEIKKSRLKVDKFEKKLRKIETLDEVNLGKKEAMGYNLGSIGKGNIMVLTI